jgi:hypothetical protein
MTKAYRNRFHEDLSGKLCDSCKKIVLPTDSWSVTSTGKVVHTRCYGVTKE